MPSRLFRSMVLLLLLCAGTTEAAYRYRRHTGLDRQQGFFVAAEGGMANARNTDTVVATIESVQDFGGGVNFVTPVAPEWDDEFSGRLGFGYQWAGGNAIVATVWGFDTKQVLSGDGPLGGALHYAIGPPIFTGGDFVGDSGSPGFFDITAEVEASTADVAWTRSQVLGESLTMEWSLGLRYANIEETLEGVYDDRDSTSLLAGEDRYLARKSNEGDMLGVRAALRTSYRFSNSFSIGGALGFSFLDGEVSASSSLVPIGTVNSATTPSSSTVIEDDGRSGNIRDFEVQVAYHAPGERLRVWIGWEQSVWDHIAADLVRSFPGTAVRLDERDSATISGYKIGVSFLF